MPLHLACASHTRVYILTGAFLFAEVGVAPCCGDDGGFGVAFVVLSSLVLMLLLKVSVFVYKNKCVPVFNVVAVTIIANSLWDLHANRAEVRMVQRLAFAR